MKFSPKLASRLTLTAVGALLLVWDIGGALSAVTSLSARRDLQFGDTAPDGAIAGTAVMDTGATKTVGGGAFDLGGTLRAGRFSLRGAGASAYVCSLPASIILTSGGNTLTVDSFTTDLALTGTLPNNGRRTMNIGGTMQISAGQAAGAYAGTMDLTCDGISDTINVTGTLGAVLAITNTGGLDFGLMSPTGTAGTVTVDSAGARTFTNVDLFTSTVTAASFSVTGEPSMTYVISYPASALLTGPGTDITLNTFTDNAPSPQLTAGGTGTFNVGGTISIGAAQAGGTYSGSFAVTVNYN